MAAPEADKWAGFNVPPLAACVFDGVQEGGNFATILNIFWKANDPSGKIHGISWNGKNFILHGLPVNGNDSPQGPAACTFNSFPGQAPDGTTVVTPLIYIFWVANNETSAIHFTRSFTGEPGSWPPDESINGTDSTPEPVSAVVFGGRCFVFWKANDPSNAIYFSAANRARAHRRGSPRAGRFR